MVIPSLLLKEKVVKLAELSSSAGKKLRGFVRLVKDKNGLKTCGFFLDKKAFAELLESMEYSSTEFWKELEASRKSGRVSSKEIEKRLGIK